MERVTIATHAAPHRTWAEIDLTALEQNLAFLQAHQPAPLTMAILKANAYGHGIEELANFLDHLGLAYFGVASVIEARQLSALDVQTPIYLLGPTFPGERDEIIDQRWVPCLSSIEEAHDFELRNTGKPALEAHIVLDTGMGRGGILPTQLPTLVDFLEHSCPHLKLVGIGSHLPSADEDPEFTINQIARFDEAVAPYKHLPFIHIANSAGLLAYHSTHANLVRPGLMLYGASPLAEFQSKLKPVMTLKSHVSIVRTLPAGHSVSYGRDVLLQRDTQVATIGAGYGDGYPRSLSNQGAEVLIRGTRCPVLGRVTMDQIMVDVTDLEHVEAGDEVELFGPHILVTEIAKKAGTIAWEIFTGISPRVTRVHRWH